MILGTSELKKAINELGIVDIINDYALQGSSIDLCIGETAKIHIKSDLIDLSKDVNLDDYYETIELAKDYKLMPGQYMYANTIEKIKIPNNMCAFIMPRSSFARMGLLLPVSQYANPGYEGHLPIIIHNISPSPVYIPPYFRVMQLILCEVNGEVKKYGEQLDVKYQDEKPGRTPKFDDFEFEEIVKKLNA